MAEGSNLSPYDIMGSYLQAVNVLASGVGVRTDKDIPYVTRQGTTVKEDDWSLDEEDRFGIAYKIQDANALPSPASYDENGEYWLKVPESSVNNPVGVEKL